MLHQYLPILVFAALGILVGAAFATLNLVLGPKRFKDPTTSAGIRQSDPYECGLPSEISKSFRFGVSFYLVAMLFILFDIEVVFLYPVGGILKSADSVFVLVEVIVFVALLFVALVYVWRKGALDWR
ncbi:MAG: NADH-quinone oxidoreductase subunit A [Solirubrobacterales bacterium]|nr:NADH-quinone oxidoreductase subunit A [Solirubrobacterales bacterium]